MGVLENFKRVFYAKIKLSYYSTNLNFLKDEINSEVPFVFFIYLKKLNKCSNVFLFFKEIDLKFFLLEQTEFNGSNSEPLIKSNLMYLRNISRDK